jgi:hypothetical protein
MSFQTQSFDGEAWPDVQRRINPSKYVSPPKSSSASRPILVGYGNYRKAVSDAIVVQTWPTVRLVVDMSKLGFKDNYAKFLNDGTPKMPRRRVMGRTNELAAREKKLITDTIDRIWQA